MEASIDRMSKQMHVQQDESNLWKNRLKNLQQELFDLHKKIRTSVSIIFDEDNQIEFKASIGSFSIIDYLNLHYRICHIIWKNTSELKNWKWKM